MRRIFRFAVALCLVLAAAAGAAVLWEIAWLAAPGPLVSGSTIVIDRGQSAGAIGRQLAQAGIITPDFAFAPAVWATRFEGVLRPGEYAFSAAITPQGVIDLLRSGKTVVHRLVVPEGLTTAEILVLVEHGEALAGDLTERPGEGRLWPATYSYSFGDKRQGLIDHMTKLAAQNLVALWSGRDADLPIDRPEQAVTLASIVEKETAIPAERPKIAAVLYNRLRLGMKLQMDPTVVYAVTEGRHPLDHPLTHAELEIESPYNTYLVKGLPPGPIGNPGRAALEAVLKPEHSNLLYFVADGSGGHAFAATLEAHNRNVAHWREVEAERAGVGK
ncbi:MAG: endolytic transglycosylase MltG [Aliidongia sp.]